MPRSPILLALALGTGAAVLVPAGVAARSPSHRHELAVDSRCEDSRELAEHERGLMAGHFEGPGQAPIYRARVRKFEGDGCKPHKGCRDLQRDLADLSSARAGAVEPGADSTLATAEQLFLRKFCSS